MAKEANFAHVKEHTKFTNPHIRFRRIKGRIVPIFGRKRIGQSVSKAGKKTAKAGAYIGAGTLIAKKTSVGKATIKGLKKVAEKASNFKIKTKMSKAVVPYSRQRAITKKLRGKAKKIAGTATKKAFKHSGKIGVGLMLGGAATYLIGSHIETTSRVGKDF